MDIESLPLVYRTPLAWAEAAVEAPLDVLNDHAWLEKKAASNALELLSQWSGPDAPPQWIANLTAVARDETDHLARVCRLLYRRGGRMSKWHRNDYARELRDCVRRGRGPDELVDRLLVSALIEVRSCERIALLLEASQDAEWNRLCRTLAGSEFGHYTVFLDLAATVQDAAAVEQRWLQLLHAEAAIIARQPPGPRIHAGPP